MNATPPDLDSCASEPIRVPGAIQPHGRMLVLDAADVAGCWRSAPTGATRREREASARRDRGARLAGAGRRRVAGRRSARSALGGDALDVSAHRARRHRVRRIRAGQRRRRHARARSTRWRATSCRSCSARAASTNCCAHRGARAQAPHRLRPLHGLPLRRRGPRRGAGRGDGRRLRPLRRPPLPGLATSRPQARALYRLNYIRLIPDAHYVPVPLLPRRRRRSRRRRIDLSLAGAAQRLAGAPRVHAQHGHAGVDVGVHRRARRAVGPGLVPRPRRRASCRSRRAPPASTWAGCCRCRSRRPRSAPRCEQRLELRELTLQIIAQRADLDASLLGLVNEPAPLLRLARASGVAVVLDDECRAAGEVPPGATQMLRAGANGSPARRRRVVRTDRAGRRLAAAPPPGAASARACWRCRSRRCTGT